LAGRGPGLGPAADVERHGFETAIAVPAAATRAAVEALDEGGTVLGRSRTLIL
jgi:hypothetical protein